MPKFFDAPWEYACGPRSAARAWSSGLRDSPRRPRPPPSPPKERKDALEATELLHALFPGEGPGNLLAKRPVEWLVWKLVWADDDVGFAETLLQQFVGNRPQNKQYVKTLLIHHMQNQQAAARCMRLLELVDGIPADSTPKEDTFMYYRPPPARPTPRALSRGLHAALEAQQREAELQREADEKGRTLGAQRATRLSRAVIATWHRRVETRATVERFLGLLRLVDRKLVQAGLRRLLLFRGWDWVRGRPAARAHAAGRVKQARAHQAMMHWHGFSAESRERREFEEHVGRCLRQVRLRSPWADWRWYTNAKQLHRRLCEAAALYRADVLASRSVKAWLVAVERARLRAGRSAAGVAMVREARLARGLRCLRSLVARARRKRLVDRKAYQSVRRRYIVPVFAYWRGWRAFARRRSAVLGALLLRSQRRGVEDAWTLWRRYNAHLRASDFRPAFRRIPPTTARIREAAMLREMAESWRGEPPGLRRLERRLDGVRTESAERRLRSCDRPRRSRPRSAGPSRRIGTIGRPLPW